MIIVWPVVAKITYVPPAPSSFTLVETINVKPVNKSTNTVTNAISMGCVSNV